MSSKSINSEMQAKAWSDDVEVSSPVVDEDDQDDDVSSNILIASFQHLNTDKMKAKYATYCAYLVVPIYVLIVLVGSIVALNHANVDVVDSAPGNESGANATDADASLPASWSLLLSSLPFVLVVNGILGLNVSSSIVAPFTLIVTCVIAIWFFPENGCGADIDTASVAGTITLTIVDRVLWTVFEYAFNVFAAFLFLEVVERWGIVMLMQTQFERVASDPAKKITLIAFCFAIMIAVVAPGGSNFLIAGSILIRMNIGNRVTSDERLEDGKRIAAICLFGNGLTSAFNLVGVCIIAIAEDIIPLVVEAGVSGVCADGDLDCAKKQIGYHFSLQFMLFCIVSPVIMAWLFLKDWRAPGFRNNLPMMLACGFVYGVVQLITARFIGPELPCLTAAGMAFLFYLGHYSFTKKARVGDEEAGDSPPNTTFKDTFNTHRYVLPFALLLGSLLLVRVVPGFEDVLQGGTNPSAQAILNPVIFDVVSECGKWKRFFPWLSHSGMIVCWCAIATPFLVPRTKNDEELRRSFAESVGGAANLDADDDEVEDDVSEHPNLATIKAHDHSKTFFNSYYKVMKNSFVASSKASLPIMVSIASYAALAKVMSGFSMTQNVANAIVSVFSASPLFYAFIMPTVGMLGSGLTGSTTTSNFLFGRLQVQTAIDLGLVGVDKGSAWAVAGVQILGSSAGEIISPMNAVFSAVLLKSACKESDIIRMVIPVFAAWLLVCMLTSLIALGAMAA